MHSWLLFCSAILCSTLTMADDGQAIGWRGSIDGGYIHSSTSSSESTQTLYVNIAMTHTGAYWVNILSAEGLNVQGNTVNGNTEPERYLAAYKARHFFDIRDYFMYRAQWEKDLASNHEYQSFSSLGLGRSVLNSENESLKFEMGPGVRYTAGKLSHDQREAIGLFSWDYFYQFNIDSRFVQKANIEYGSSDKVTRVNTQLQQNITHVIALTLNHDYKHVNGDAPTRESIMSIGMSYQL